MKLDRSYFSPILWLFVGVFLVVVVQWGVFRPHNLHRKFSGLNYLILNLVIFNIVWILGEVLLLETDFGQMVPFTNHTGSLFRS